MQKRCRNLWTRQSIALAFAGALSFGANVATADVVSCGDVLTEDTVFENDLSDCPGDSVVIGADHITVDLDVHPVSGGGCASSSEVGTVGIRTGGIRHVGVRNGKVSGCGTGMVLEDSRHCVLDAMGVSSYFQRIVLPNSYKSRLACLAL